MGHFTGCGIKVQQSTSGPLCSRMFCDQVFGQVEGKITNFHLRKLAPGISRSQIITVGIRLCLKVQLEHSCPVDVIRAIFIDQQSNVVLALGFAPAYFTFQSIQLRGEVQPETQHRRDRYIKIAGHFHSALRNINGATGE